MMGDGSQHEWDESKHIEHKNQWAAETIDGKRGVEQQKIARTSGEVSGEN